MRALGRLRRLTLSERFRLGVSVVLIVLTLDGGVAVYAVGERNRLVELQAEVLNPATSVTTELFEALVDQETAARGFVITGDEAFLAPFDRGRLVEASALTDLRRLLVTYPALLVDLEEVRRAAARWREEAALPEIEAVRAGDPAAARAIVASGDGIERFEVVRQTLAGVRTDLGVLQEEGRARSDLARTRVSNALFANVAVGLLATLLLTFLVRRWVTRPIKATQEAMRAVASGALERRIPTHGPPELAAIAGDAEAMRVRILAEVEHAVRARETVAQSGLIALALRQQLAPAGPSTEAVAAVAARFESAEGVVAGDWYDLWPVGEASVRLALVDVSGHGAGAGIIALRAKQLLQAASRDGLDPGASLTWVADQLGDTDELFLTGIVVDLDHGRRTCTWANAGHPSGLLRVQGDVAHLGPTGPLLGPVPGPWSSRVLPLDAGSFVLVHTDGLIEARDAGGDELGERAIEAIVRAAALSADVDEVADECMSTLARFRSERLADDVTLVVLRPLTVDRSDARRSPTTSVHFCN